MTDPECTFPKCDCITEEDCKFATLNATPASSAGETAEESCPYCGGSWLVDAPVPHPSAGVPSREAIARVIDPDSWATADRYVPTLAPEHQELATQEFCKRSLAKADAILALYPTPPGEGGDFGSVGMKPSREGDAGGGSYQARVGAWMIACFGDDITNDKSERAFRFLEEALELVQALGATRDQVDALVAYTYGRPAGEVSQEVGGVMVTLATLCSMAGVDLDACAEGELARVWTKIDKIRAKHAAKPKDVKSSLPGYAASVAPEAQATAQTCANPDHDMYPHYGVAPHECFYKKGPEFKIGQSTLLPRDHWPDNFVLDVEDGEDPATITYPSACGTYYCPTCKEGMPVSSVGGRACPDRTQYRSPRSF